MDLVSTIIKEIEGEGTLSPGPASDAFVRVLQGLVENSQDIVGAMITSQDGHPKAQILPRNLDPRRFAAMSSALQALSMEVILSFLQTLIRLIVPSQ